MIFKKLIGSIMIKPVVKFLVNAMVDSSKNTIDDTVRDIIFGYLDSNEKKITKGSDELKQWVLDKFKK